MKGTFSAASAAASSPAVSPIRYACATACSRAQRASAANGVPLRLPPRITRRPEGYARSATIADSGFVALESLTKRTPPSSRTGSSRFGTPGNVRSASPIAPSGTPSARAAAVAAAAFARLCSPGMRGSAGSGSPAANSTRRARPGTGPKPRGTTATSSGRWRSKSRSFASV